MTDGVPHITRLHCVIRGQLVLQSQVVALRIGRFHVVVFARKRHTAGLYGF